MTGVLIAEGMFIPPQAARKKRAVKAKIVFIMIASDWTIVSEIRKKAIAFLHKMRENKGARRWLPPSASGGYFCYFIPNWLPVKQPQETV